MNLYLPVRNLLLHLYISHEKRRWETLDPPALSSWTCLCVIPIWQECVGNLCVKVWASRAVRIQQMEKRVWSINPRLLAHKISWGGFSGSLLFAAMCEICVHSSLSVASKVITEYHFLLLWKPIFWVSGPHQRTDWVLKGLRQAYVCSPCTRNNEPNCCRAKQQRPRSVTEKHQRNQR